MTLDEMKEKAEAAGKCLPGPWVQRYHPGCDDGPHMVSTAHGKSQIRDRTYITPSIPQYVASHIATFSPPRVLALIRVCQALKEGDHNRAYAALDVLESLP